MTTQYGRAAVKATELLTAGKYESPEDAWDEAIKEETKSPSSQSKGCPRYAYLGLCEDGFVREVTCGDYTKSVLNKEYAVKIALAIKANPELTKTTKAKMWKYAETDAGESGQVGVVLALWNSDLIV